MAVDVAGRLFEPFAGLHKISPGGGLQRAIVDYEERATAIGGSSRLPVLLPRAITTACHVKDAEIGSAAARGKSEHENLKHRRAFLTGNALAWHGRPPREIRNCLS